MEHVKIDFQRMQAEYFLKYDYKFDETALAMLHILGKVQDANFAKQNSALNKAIEKIEASQRTLALDREHPRWQAWVAFIIDYLFLSYILHDPLERSEAQNN